MWRAYRSAAVQRSMPLLDRGQQNRLIPGEPGRVLLRLFGVQGRHVNLQRIARTSASRTSTIYIVLNLSITSRGVVPPASCRSCAFSVTCRQ